MRVEAIILPRFLHTFHQWKSMGLAAWATQANTDKRKTTSEPFRFCYSPRWISAALPPEWRTGGKLCQNKAMAGKVYHRQIPDRWECCIWKRTGHWYRILKNRTISFCLGFSLLWVATCALAQKRVWGKLLIAVWTGHGRAWMPAALAERLFNITSNYVTAPIIHRRPKKIKQQKRERQNSQLCWLT